MNRIILLGLTLACLALAASSSGRVRVQSKALDERTTVTLKDAWIYGSSNQMLRAKIVFEGSDPNVKYNLKAALRADENGDDIKSIYVWYVGLTPHSIVPTNRVEMLWEFRDFPTNTPSIYLHEDFLDRATGREAKSLNFVLPGAKRLRLRDTSVD
jgi:hypothetical protein